MITRALLAAREMENSSGEEEEVVEEEEDRILVNRGIGDEEAVEDVY